MNESWKEISEQAATGETARLYLDIKRTLRVPIVNLLYRVWAAEQGVLPLLWATTYPNLQTIDFENKADSLRTEAVEKLAYDVAVSTQSTRLNALNFNAGDIEKIRLELNVFHYVNPKLLLQCALLKRALGLWGYRGTSRPLGQVEPGVPSEMPKEIVMVDSQPPDREVGQLFDEIRNRLKLPAVNSDYRALAKWPHYLRLAWMDLRPYHDSPYYEVHQRALRSYAMDLVSGLPYSARISSEDAKRHGVDRGHLIKLIDLFFELLPGLILNIAFLKIALDGAEQAGKSPFPVKMVARV